MATTTPNLGLVKPDYNDLADIDVINDNMDTIDAAVSVRAVFDTANGLTGASFGFASAGNPFLRWTVGDITYQLLLRSSDIRYEKRENGTWTTIWTK